MKYIHLKPALIVAIALITLTSLNSFTKNIPSSHIIASPVNDSGDLKLFTRDTLILYRRVLSKNSFDLIGSAYITYNDTGTWYRDYWLLPAIDSQLFINTYLNNPIYYAPVNYGYKRTLDILDEIDRNGTQTIYIIDKPYSKFISRLLRKGYWNKGSDFSGTRFELKAYEFDLSYLKEPTQTDSIEAMVPTLQKKYFINSVTCEKRDITIHNIKPVNKPDITYTYKFGKGKN